MMSDLQNLIIQFIQSQEKNLQFDFYSRNQIVLQIYKLNDVRNWGYGIERQITDHLIIELTFNKQKIDNENNKGRFLNSDLFQKFYRFDTIKEDSYWTGIDSEQDIKLVERRIMEIINKVYNINGKNIEFTLNAY